MRALDSRYPTPEDFCDRQGTCRVHAKLKSRLFAVVGKWPDLQMFRDGDCNTYDRAHIERFNSLRASNAGKKSS